MKVKRRDLDPAQVDRMSAYWDEQQRTSNEVSSVNQNRANVLGKFIDMTVPR